MSTTINSKETKIPLNKLKTNKEAVTSSKAPESPKKLMRQLDDKPKQKRTGPTKPNPALMTVVALVIVAAGTLTGFGLSKATGSSGSGGVKKGADIAGVEQGTGKIEEGQVKKGAILGNPEKTGDEADGVLAIGGINGEGSHRLLRPGGPSQTVYLTSSVVDLNQLNGHRVKVWGETFSAQSAGWLMDVVTVEVLELDAPRPFEED